MMAITTSNSIKVKEENAPGHFLGNLVLFFFIARKTPVIVASRGGAVAGAGELELLHRAAARGAAARVQRVDGTDEEGGRDGRTTTCIVLTAECTIISILFFGFRV